MSALYLVATPIGNLDDITLRARDVLGTVSRVLAEDTRRTRILLDHLQIRTPLVSLHAHNEASRIEKVLSWLEDGESLALVSDAGTPLVSDPGARLVRAVTQAGYEVVPVPGPSAVLAALVASGLPADRFTFLGFLPRKGRERRDLLHQVAEGSVTTVVFESPQRLVGTLDDLVDACGGAREVAVARELTKVHESFHRGTLLDARAYYQAHPPRGEVTVVVGPGVGVAEDEAGMEAKARELARSLLAQGLRSSQVAREVAERTGVSRNLAYRIVHSPSE
jgi:16S rRNA (cytidine1402-2'-O)-methyltransferase